MFGIGAQEIILIGIVALLIVGPKKLPEMARSLGKGFREFKRTADGVSEGIRDSLSDGGTDGGSSAVAKAGLHAHTRADEAVTAVASTTPDK